MQKANSDLFLVAGLTIVALVVILLAVENVFIRTIVGLPLVLALPGYALTAVIFPQDQFDAPSRLLFSLGLSLAVAIAGGLVLHFLPGGLNSLNWVILLSTVTLGSVLAASARRMGDAWLERGEWNFPQLSISQGVLLAVALLVAALAVGLARQPAPLQGLTGYSTLWIAPEDTRDEFDAANEIHIGLQNLEFSEQQYRIELVAGGSVLYEWNAITLSPGEVWETTLNRGVFAEAGWRPLEAHLYRTQDADSVYRQVRLWP